MYYTSWLGPTSGISVLFDRKALPAGYIRDRRLSSVTSLVDLLGKPGLRFSLGPLLHTFNRPSAPVLLYSALVYSHLRLDCT